MSNVARTDFLSYGYALIVLTGGVMGYVKAGSLASLMAGVIFGSVSAFGAYQISQNPRNLQLAFLTSGALLTVMGLRFYKSGKFMPAGLMSSISLMQFVRLGLRYYQQQ